MLEELLDELSKKTEDLERWMMSFGDQINPAIRYALDQITPLAQSMMTANLEASGIGSDTGKLKSAVARSMVFLKGSRIIVAMPRGEAPYEGGRSFYKTAQALSSGAVHTSSEKYGNQSFLGAKAKRTLKKYTYGSNSASRRRLEKSYDVRGQGLKLYAEPVQGKKSSSPGASVWITKPYGFYKLSAFQQQILVDKFKKAIQEKIGG